jgi:hypothetical protein
MGVLRQGGGTRRWLGDKAVKALEKAGHKALVQRLDEDLKALARQAAEPPPGDWRTFSLPFSDGQELSRIQVAIRRPPGEEDAEESAGKGRRAAKANRFLIDLELSRMGRMQLDGLTQGARFDLILRTPAPLPAEVRREISALFTAALEEVRLAGGLSFQAGSQGWVTPVPAAPPRHVGVTA